MRANDAGPLGQAMPELTSPLCFIHHTFALFKGNAHFFLAQQSHPGNPARSTHFPTTSWPHSPIDMGQRHEAISCLFAGITNMTVSSGLSRWANRLVRRLPGVSWTFAVAILLVSASGVDAQQGSAWQPTLESARRVAAQTNRLVLAYFWGAGCPACRMMEQEVLGQPSFAENLQSNYVLVKVNVEHFPSTGERYRISLLPTTLVLLPDDQVLDRIQGRVEAGQYLARLNRVAMDTRQRFAQVAAMRPAGPPVEAAVQPPIAGPPQPGAAPMGPTQAGSSTAGPPSNPGGPWPPGPARPDRSPPSPEMASLAERQGFAPIGPVNSQQPPAGAPKLSDDRYADYFNQRAPHAQTPSPPTDRASPGLAAGENRSLPGPQTSPAMGPAAPNSMSSISPPMGPPMRESPAVPPPLVGDGPRMPSQPMTAHSPLDRPPLANRPFSIPSAQAPAPPGTGTSEGGRPASPPVGSAPPVAPNATATAANPPVGLEGYCPVHLCEKQAWVVGVHPWGAIHRGRTYLFKGPDEQRRFLEAPDRYAPVLSGNDPVLALEQGQTVNGRREHGVFYKGRIYLFSSEDTLKRFEKNADHYAALVLQAMAPTPDPRSAGIPPGIR